MPREGKRERDGKRDDPAGSGGGSGGGRRSRGSRRSRSSPCFFPRSRHAFGNATLSGREGNGKGKGTAPALASLHDPSSGEGVRDGKGRGSGQFLGRGAFRLTVSPRFPSPPFPCPRSCFFARFFRETEGTCRETGGGRAKGRGTKEGKRDLNISQVP